MPLTNEQAQALRKDVNRFKNEVRNGMIHGQSAIAVAVDGGEDGAAARMDAAFHALNSAYMEFQIAAEVAGANPDAPFAPVPP